MKVIVAGLAALGLGACASGPELVGVISPAIYIQEGYVVLADVTSLDACASAVRTAATAADPKSLGEFHPNPQKARNKALGGCANTRGYYWVYPDKVEFAGSAVF